MAVMDQKQCEELHCCCNPVFPRGQTEVEQAPSLSCSYRKLSPGNKVWGLTSRFHHRSTPEDNGKQPSGFISVCLPVSLVTVQMCMRAPTCINILKAMKIRVP